MRYAWPIAIFLFVLLAGIYGYVGAVTMGWLP